MSIFGHAKMEGYDVEPYKTFCGNLKQYLAKLQRENLQQQESLVELRNQIFVHFVAAHRLIKTAIKDDPLFRDLRHEFASLANDKYLQVVGLMHAHSARRRYTVSSADLPSLFQCIAASYGMPDGITSKWDPELDMETSARIRAQQFVEILGRRRGAQRLAPTLTVIDRRILVYLAFLMQEPEAVLSVEWNPEPLEPRTVQ